MIKIVIADDHPLVREGIRRIVEGAEGVKVVAEAATGREAVHRVRETKPDVLLLDISMPEGGGIETLRNVKDKTRVLILSMHPEDQYAIRMLKEGASGYLSKSSATTDLIDAIKRVHSGRRYISPTLADRLADTLDSGFEEDPHDKLSARELQILCMIGSGKSVSQIGEELLISVKTVSTHRTRILEKMGMKHNLDLIRYAVSKGLVPD